MSYTLVAAADSSPVSFIWKKKKKYWPQGEIIYTQLKWDISLIKMSSLELTWHSSFSERVCTYTQRCTILFITEQSLWSAFIVQLFKEVCYQGWFFISLSPAVEDHFTSFHDVPSIGNVPPELDQRLLFECRHEESLQTTAIVCVCVYIYT